MSRENIISFDKIEERFKEEIPEYVKYSIENVYEEDCCTVKEYLDADWIADVMNSQLDELVEDIENLPERGKLEELFVKVAQEEINTFVEEYNSESVEPKSILEENNDMDIKILIAAKFLEENDDPNNEWIGLDSYEILVLDVDKFRVIHEPSQITMVVETKYDSITKILSDLDEMVKSVIEMDCKLHNTFGMLQKNYYSEIESAPPLTAKTVMGSAPDKIEPSSEMDM